jgi:8-oxo-dGTP diphosphatase
MAIVVAIDVAAAVVRDGAGRYLITRRLPNTHLAGLWEFPGGKCDPGETLEECLRRELHEELGAEFAVGEKIDAVVWRYPEKIVALHFFRCTLVAGTIEPRAAQALVWVEPERLADYDFPPPDQALIARLRAGG